MIDKVYDLIIVGSGPAGYTAAIYAARADLKPLMFEGVNLGGAPGGQLMLTSEVENYPGFPDGIQGPELMALMKKQAKRFGTEMILQDIAKVDFKNRPFILTAGDGKTYQAKAVIVATGATARWLGIESEERLKGLGVSACATCDGVFFRDKDVAMVGGGDTALEEALFLTKFVSSVTVLVRKDEDSLRASEIMIKRAKGHKKIKFMFNTEVVEIHDPKQKKVTGVTVKNNKTNQMEKLDVQGVFIAIGHKPNTSVFRDQLEVDKVGYLIVKDGSKTNIEGVFAAGDVHDHVYRQAITAAGSGCIAALDVQHYLEDQAG